MTKREAIQKAFLILEEAFPKGRAFHYRLIGSIVVALAPSDAHSYSVVTQTIYTVNEILNKSKEFKKTRKGFYQYVR